MIDAIMRRVEGLDARVPSDVDPSMATEKGPRIWRVLLPLLVIAAVVPFYGKPPHIDEESYLFIGNAIEGHLARPYDWWRPWQPLFTPTANSFIYAHPPVFLWLISGLGQLWGFEAIGLLRASMLPFCLLLVLSFYGMARRLTKRAGLTSVAFLFSPGVLLVLHQSLMIDLPFIALSALGGLLLIETGRSQRSWMSWLAGAVIGLAALTKYPAFLLLPVALVASAPGGRWLAPRVAGRVVGGSMAIVVPWEIWTWVSYGTPHLWYVLCHATDLERSHLGSRVVGNLTHLGWTLFAPPIAMIAFLAHWRRPLRLAIALSVTVGVLALLLGALALPTNDTGIFSEMASELVRELPSRPTLLFLQLLAIFLGALVLGTICLRRGPDRFLTTWAALAVAAVLLAHNYASARYLVFAAAPLHLLFWRYLERAELPTAGRLAWGATLAGAALSIGIATADLRLARVYPALGRQIETVVAREATYGGCVWFTGEWGFRREMEQRGYRYIIPGTHFARGDLVIVPTVAGPRDLPSMDGLIRVHRSEVGEPGMRTMSPRDGIGYYSEVFGMLPFGTSSGPLEEVEVWKVL